MSWEREGKGKAGAEQTFGTAHLLAKQHYTVKITYLMALNESGPKKPPRPDLADADYYLTPEGYVVFTALHHQKRGYCCKNGCRHCPYGFRKEK